jgi:deoxyribonuclease V
MSLTVKSSKKFVSVHAWDVSPADAIVIQNSLRQQVVAHDCYGDVTTVAGVDVGFLHHGDVTRAAVAVLSFPKLEMTQAQLAELPTTFPYVPGLLSFREIPAVLAALEKCSPLPDLILCDGQGLAHPRRFGIACHLGVLTQIPTIGVAKSRLIGEHDPVPNRKGATVKLWHKGECIGVVLRTRENVKPVYVSVGHRVSLDSATEWVMRCVTKYRLPETTRQAHRLASAKVL